MGKGGIAAETEYPYIGDAYSQECYFDNSTVVEAKVKSYKMVSPQGSEDALAKVVAENGPVSVAIDASGFQHYRGGLFYEPHCSSTYLSHAVIVVGYAADYWIIKNSWGTQWGEEGYINMAKDRENNCGIATYPWYVAAHNTNTSNNESTLP